MNSKKKPTRTSSQKKGGRDEETDSESDEEPQPGTSQSTQSQRGRGKASGESQDRPGKASSQVAINNQQIDRLVSDLVTYLLITNQSKCSVTRTDITKNVLKEYSRSFDVIFQQAQKKLRQVFAIDVKELPSKKGRYILVNALKNLGKNVHVSWSKADNCNFGLLTVILTMIYMNGNTILEDELWSALEDMGVSTAFAHENFGDVHKLIAKDFVQQHYLEYKRVPDKDPPVNEFTWGPRAKLEVCKMELLEFACKIYDNKPEDWPAQLADAKEELGK